MPPRTEAGTSADSAARIRRALWRGRWVSHERRLRKLKSSALDRSYQALAARTPGVHFVGRLATYRYYNMDQVTAQALTLYAKLAGISRREALASPA